MAAARRKPAVDPVQQAVVNLTWLARAVEDGRSWVDAAIEVYGKDDGAMARDLRTLIHASLAG